MISRSKWRPLKRSSTFNMLGQVHRGLICRRICATPTLRTRTVFPGATHAFNVPFEKPTDYLGHHFEHDEKATQEAQKDADAFMGAHMK
jgi:dienelactone hydrolase